MVAGQHSGVVEDVSVWPFVWWGFGGVYVEHREILVGVHQALLDCEVAANKGEGVAVPEVATIVAASFETRIDMQAVHLRDAIDGLPHAVHTANGPVICQGAEWIEHHVVAELVVIAHLDQRVEPDYIGAA